jgi:predicted CopG family antitoxin
MSTQSTGDKSTQIRVLPEVYNKLFEKKLELEKEQRKQVSFNDVLNKLLTEKEVLK